MELAPGTVLLGKYRVDELIGTGGMGNVVRASHLYLHQSVAIKIMLPQLSEDASTVQRFLREAQATVKLRSEHSARVMDVGTTPDGAPFMVMEFLDGSDLHQILRHHGPQPPTVATDLMLQACEGIAEAHALGIIHRDIKPSNFFVTRRPDGSMLLKILDFGISKTPVGYDELTCTQTVIGTPTYMAPEQMKSGRSADPRSDIWSIGVVLYQLLTGRPPFAGETYADLVLKVGLEPPEPIQTPLPPGLGEAVMRCLEKDPKARHQNVGDLARAIAPYATDPVSGMQAAARVGRILVQRGAAPVSLLTTGGSLSSGIPMSLAQLTPPSHVTSLSQSAGQVTVVPRGNRGWMFAGIMGLCVLAGVGGYAVSQLSKTDRDEPHVLAPAAKQPIAMPPASPAPSPAAPPSIATPPTATPPSPGAIAPAAPNVATPATAGQPAPSEPAPSVTAPTAQPAPASTAAKPVASTPAVSTAAKPVASTPTASTAAKPVASMPAASTPAKPSDAKTSAAKPTDGASDAKPTTKSPSDTKPTRSKPKKDDLFDKRH